MLNLENELNEYQSYVIKCLQFVIPQGGEDILIIINLYLDESNV